jgi:hypothetical protein
VEDLLKLGKSTVFSLKGILIFALCAMRHTPSFSSLINQTPAAGNYTFAAIFAQSHWILP